MRLHTTVYTGAKQLPTVCKAVDKMFDKVLAWYNFEHKRLDLQFYRPEVKDCEVLPGLRITYETGYPYEDDEAKPQLLRRSRQR